jgi:hypothetical protein
MNDNTNGRARLGGRATNGLVMCCWGGPCTHDAERHKIEAEFLRDFYPWSMDDAAWLALMGMGFQ